MREASERRHGLVPGKTMLVILFSRILALELAGL